MKLEKDFKSIRLEKDKETGNTIKKEVNIGVRLYDLTYKEIIGFLKTRIKQVSINARSTKTKTEFGYPVLSRVSVKHADDKKVIIDNNIGKPITREYSDMLDCRLTHYTEKDGKYKKVLDNEESTQTIDGLISGFLATKLMKVKDTEVDIVIHKDEYERYAELINMFKHINDDMLEKIISIELFKPAKNLAYYVITFPDKNGFPCEIYYFKGNNSILTFDNHGFNVEIRKDIRSITDLIGG